MMRVLFLILILMSSFVFAQTTEEKPQATKVDEFGQLPNGDMKARFDAFYNEVSNIPTTKGAIIIYGSARQTASQERFFKQYIRFRRVDTSRIEIIKRGHRNEIMTQFWSVPLGAEKPKLEPTAYIFKQFWTITNRSLNSTLKFYFAELNKNQTFQGYIINYGTSRQIAGREKLIRNQMIFRRTDSPRITFVNGGKAYGLNSVLWIVPDGAKVPKP